MIKNVNLRWLGNQQTYDGGKSNSLFCSYLNSCDDDDDDDDDDHDEIEMSNQSLQGIWRCRICVIKN